MAHGITARDQVFTVRKPAWHFAQTKHLIFDDYPTRQQAQEAVHPWEPVEEPIFRIIEVLKHDDVLTTFCLSGQDVKCEVPGHWIKKRELQEITESRHVTRSDDRSISLGVKPTERPLITNESMYDIADAIMGSEGGMHIETGGSLHEGRKVWLLLSFDEPMKIGGRERTETMHYFALQNDHTGQGAFRGQGTDVCIVCDNTSKMADMDASLKGTEFVFRHTKNVSERIEEAKEALAGWRTSVKEYHRLAEHLIDVPITREQRTLFIHEFIPMPQENLISPRVRQNVVDGRSKMIDIFNGPTQESIKDSAWGLVQGAIEYSQWYRKAKSDQTRFERAYLKRSALTTDALALAQEVARA